MPTKRAIAKADAAELIDIESRLAPFFPPPTDASLTTRAREPEPEEGHELRRMHPSGSPALAERFTDDATAPDGDVRRRSSRPAGRAVG